MTSAAQVVGRHHQMITDFYSVSLSPTTFLLGTTLAWTIKPDKWHDKRHPEFKSFTKIQLCFDEGCDVVTYNTANICTVSTKDVIIIAFSGWR